MWSYVKILMLVGFVKILFDLLQLCYQRYYSGKYWTIFNEFVREREYNDENYQWLKVNLRGMEKQLKTYGVLSGALYDISRTKLLIGNVSLTYDINEALMNVRDVFLDYDGKFKYSMKRLGWSMVNPIKWIFEGVLFVFVFLFGWIPYWTEITKHRKKIEKNFAVKGLSFLVTIISIVGNIVTIVGEDHVRVVRDKILYIFLS